MYAFRYYYTVVNFTDTLAMELDLFMVRLLAHKTHSIGLSLSLRQPLLFIRYCGQIFVIINLPLLVVLKL